MSLLQFLTSRARARLFRKKPPSNEKTKRQQEKDRTTRVGIRMKKFHCFINANVSSPRFSPPSPLSLSSLAKEARARACRRAVTPGCIITPMATPAWDHVLRHVFVGRDKMREREGRAERATTNDFHRPLRVRQRRRPRSRA